MLKQQQHQQKNDFTFDFKAAQNPLMDSVVVVVVVVVAVVVVVVVAVVVVDA